ncbi:MAG: gliding motility-associated C-terminal domain-containing protein [Flavobacteriaceae bacterium]
MKKLLLIYLVFSSLFLQQRVQGQILSVGAQEQLSLGAGGETLFVDGIEFQPSSTVILSNTQLSRVNSTAAASGIDNIQRIYVFSNPVGSYNGDLIVNYNDSEVGSLAEGDLQLTLYDGTNWNTQSPTTIDTTLNTLQATLAGLGLIQITAGVVSRTPPPPLPTDTDGDGIPDSEDDFPNDSNESRDTDGDGLGDNIDPDDDNDGYYDGIVEYQSYFFPNGSVTIYIPIDAFPLDPNEQFDSDGDGIGNEADPDNDNDGILDQQDAFPNDVSETQDSDGDGIGDNLDPDDDNDGYSDVLELEEGTNPLDFNSYPRDDDGDGIPNSTDTDDNNDGYPDDEILVPEFFSPNGDGINDQWRVINLDQYPNSVLRVYTRSGRLIFQKRGYQNDWNGTHNNSLLPEASYYYMIDLENDGQMDYTGWVYITQ